MSIIKSVIGKPYKFNCFDGIGFDCYTLIWYIYDRLGLKLPKENIAKYSLKVHKQLIKENLYKFSKVSFINRLPFDLLLFESSKSTSAHIGMVLDKKRFIHIDKDITVQIEHFAHNFQSIKLRKVYRCNL